MSIRKCGFSVSFVRVLGANSGAAAGGSPRQFSPTKKHRGNGTGRFSGVKRKDRFLKGASQKIIEGFAVLFADGQDAFNQFIRCGKVFAEIDLKNRVIIVKINVDIVLIQREEVV